MPKYLIESTYTREGIEGIRTKGARSLGGELEAYYFSFGEYDVLALLDFPDDEAAATVAVAVDAAGGAIARTTVLLMPQLAARDLRRLAQARTAISGDGSE